MIYGMQIWLCIEKIETCLKYFCRQLYPIGGWLCIPRTGSKLMCISVGRLSKRKRRRLHGLLMDNRRPDINPATCRLSLMLFGLDALLPAARRQPSGKDPLLADLGRWIVGTQRVCIGPHSARQPSSFLLPLTAYMGVNCQPNWHLKYGKSSRGGGSLNYCLLGCRLPKRSVCRAGLPDIRLLLGTWKLCSLEHVRVQSFCRTVAP